MLIILAGTFFASSVLGRSAVKAEYLKMGTTTLFGVVLLFFIVLFGYPPSITLLRALPNIPSVLSLVFLSFGESSVSVYAAGTAIWSSSQVYLVLVLFELLVIPTSLGSWIWYAIRLGNHRNDAKERQWVFLWFLQGLIGLQATFALLLDIFGGFGVGNNLALRLEPIFLVSGVPWALRLVVSGAKMVPRGVVRRILVTLCLFGIVILAVAAPLRAFIDPAVAPVSWVGYDIGEEHGVRWLAEFAPSRSVVYSQPIYTNSLASRIVWLFTMTAEPGRYGEIRFLTNDAISRPVPLGAMYFSSDTEASRRAYISANLPEVSTWSAVYDNGDAHFYWHG
jgi:hypothetical protein